MPVELTGSNNWRPTITAPAAGDPRSASSVATMGQDIADSLAYLKSQDASNYAALAALSAAKSMSPYYVTNRNTFASPAGVLTPGAGAFERIMLAQPVNAPWNWPALNTGDIVLFHAGIQFYWSGPSLETWIDSELIVSLPSGQSSPVHSLSHTNYSQEGAGQWLASYSSLLWIARVTTGSANPTFDLQAFNKSALHDLNIIGYDVVALRISGM